MTETTLVAGLPALAEDWALTAESGFLVKIKVETPQFCVRRQPRPVARQPASGPRTDVAGRIVLTAR